MALSATLARLLAVVYPRADFLPHSLGVQFSTKTVLANDGQTLDRRQGYFAEAAFRTENEHLRFD
jgi:hypothetical protein